MPRPNRVATMPNTRLDCSLATDLKLDSLLDTQLLSCSDLYTCGRDLDFSRVSLEEDRPAKWKTKVKISTLWGCLDLTPQYNAMLHATSPRFPPGLLQSLVKTGFHQAQQNYIVPLPWIGWQPPGHLTSFPFWPPHLRRDLNASMSVEFL